MRAHNSHIQPTRRSRHRRIPVLMGAAIPFKDYADGIEGFDWLHLDELTGDVALATNSALALGRQLAINGGFAIWTADDPDGWSIVGQSGSDPEVSEVGSGEGHGGVGTGSANLFTTATGNAPSLVQGVLAVGKTFTIAAVVSKVTSGNYRFGDETTTTGVISTEGTVILNLIADKTSFTFRIIGANADVTDDSILIQQTDIASDKEFPGPELHIDANAASDPNGNEADATTGWTAQSGTTFTSDSDVKAAGNFSLKYVCVGASDGIYIDLDVLGLVDGKVYKISLDARHVGVGLENNIFLSNTNSGFTTALRTAAFNNTDTTFEKITKIFTHDVNSQFLLAREVNASNDGGLYIDNLSITEQNPMNLTNTGMSIGNPGTGNVKLIYLGDGATTGLEYDTIAEWNSKYNPDKLTVILVVRVDDWGAGTDVIYRLAVDANTELVLEKRASELAWRYNVEGNFDEVTFNTATLPGGSPAGLFTMAITVDTDGPGEIIGYMKGIARGTSTITGDWIGNFDPAECAVFAGDNGQGGSLDGGGAHVGLGNRVMTPAEVQQFDQRSGL